MIPILLAAIEWIVLLALCLDLASYDGGLFTAWSRALLLCVGAAGIGLAAGRGGARRLGSWRWPVALLGIGTTLLAAAGLAAAERLRSVEAGWPSGARDRLERRARLLEADFAWLLDALVRPLATLDPDGDDRAALFARLEQIVRSSPLPAGRIGLSLHGADRTPLAWAGNDAPLPQALTAIEPGVRFAIGGREGSRLFAAVPLPEDARGVAVFVLRTPGAPRDAPLQLDFLPHWHDLGPAQVRPQERRDEAELARFFERREDRHWSRVGREEVATLTVPLRAPSGVILAIASLRDERAAVTLGEARLRLRAAGIFGAALILLAAGLAATRRPAGPGGRLLLGSSIIWSMRGVLLLVGGASLPSGAVPSWPLRLFDVTLYASSSRSGLASSAADLLLTGIGCCAQAILLRRFFAALRPPAAAGRRTAATVLAAAGLAALSIFGIGALRRFLDELVLNARVDISRVTLDGRLLVPRLALQASVFLLVAAFVLACVALLDLLWRLASRRGGASTFLSPPAPGRMPSLPRVIAGVLLLTLLYAPLLHHSYDRLRRHFFETDLVPRVLNQEAMRHRELRAALSAAQSTPFAALLPLPGEPADDDAEALGFRLWTAMPLSDSGLASSLQLFDAEGLRLTRFAVDMSPMLDVTFDAASAAAGGDLEDVPPRPGAMIREPVVFGAEWIRNAAGAPFLVVLTVVDDYSNLPILGADSIALAALRPRGLLRTNPELLRRDPSVAVFTPDLQRLYESGSEIPPPDQAIQARLLGGGPVWRHYDLEAGPARIVYVRDPHAIFALAHPHASPAGLAAATLRLLLLNGALAALAILVVRSLAWIAGARRVRLPAATYAGRLITILMASGLMPLLLLVHLVSRFTAEEFAKDVTTDGLESLQVVRRLAEDYLAAGDPGEPLALDDDVVFWLARLVRQEIDVYRDADLLATSTRELYASGWRNPRIDGAVYRAMYVDREPFWRGAERVGGTAYATLSATLRIDRAGHTGVLTMPLLSHGRAEARKTEAVQDAILLITCGAVLLLATAGYVAARRVSGPIAQLAGAARRVAEGDLEVRLAPTTRDEIGTLVTSFDRMAASLRGQREALRQRSAYIEAILRRATMGVVSVDAAGAIITINPAAQQLLAGAAPAPEPGDSLARRLSLEPTLRPLGALLDAPPSTGDARPAEAREAEIILRRGAEERRLRAVCIPFAADASSPAGLIILLEDVTEIVRSGRLAAWAEMARRVAHEIKNPLTPIQLSVQHLKRVWEARDARFETVLGECLANIQKQVAVLRRIALEFSAYARLPQMAPVPTSVAALLDTALGPYAAAPPQGVVIRREAPADLPAIVVDRNVMERALVNLIENALQAMPSGGTLSIGATVEADPRGRRVRIEVRDTGVGIEPDLLPRVFEPYFSTRSGGTGLGLGLVRRAVEDHGGAVSIDSRPGAGTVVALTLPAPPDAATEAPA